MELINADGYRGLLEQISQTYAPIGATLSHLLGRLEQVLREGVQ